VEVHLSTPSGDYVPRNYDRRVHGPVRLRAALANSYNVPAVRLTESLLPERVLEVLNGAGFASLSREAHHYGVGLVLGNGDVSLRELARAYRGLARGGLLAPLSEIRAAHDARGALLPVPKELAPSRFLPADAVALLTDILSDEGARAPAFGLDNALRFPFPVAAKTGTSRAYVDNWAVGFTRARTVAVWVGNFDGSPMRGISGITGAGPLFKRILTRAMRGIAPEALVDRSRFESASVCSLSGARAQASCPARLHEVFLPGTSPRGTCTMHRSAGTAGRERTLLDVGPEYYLWARGEALDAGPWPAATAASRGGPPHPARLLSPGDGDEFLLDPAIPHDAQSIPVRALAPPGVERLEVRTDEGTKLALLSPFAARVPARRGQHWLELWGPGGQAPLASARYRVR
jgi:penicillin-binding protein 1C